MTVAFHETFSLFGFFILITVASQLITGTMLSFSVVLEAALIPLVRDEEDLEVPYIDDFFWLHERGVDLIFIFSYCHLFKKLYMNSIDIDQETSWKSGVFTFLIFQVVTFFGLLLCCTHLSEITLTIAANIFHTIFLFYGKAYWWFFTDKTLNTDTLIRMAYMHYVSAFYMFYLAILHGIDLHYDWKNENHYDGLEVELSWWDEAFSNELSGFMFYIFGLFLVCWFLYPEPESLSYELFMWGDICIVTDVRFYGVAPHWYFRPFMAWLIVCPHHKTGILGLLLFFFTLFHQPTLHGVKSEFNRVKFGLNNLNFYTLELNIFYQISYWTFVMAMLYTSSFLPYGRFYNRLGGNDIMLISYLHIIIFLTFRTIRRPNFFNYVDAGFLQKLYVLNFMSIRK